MSSILKNPLFWGILGLYTNIYPLILYILLQKYFLFLIEEYIVSCYNNSSLYFGIIYVGNYTKA